MKKIIICFPTKFIHDHFSTPKNASSSVLKNVELRRCPSEKHRRFVLWDSEDRKIASSTGINTSKVRALLTHRTKQFHKREFPVEEFLVFFLLLHEIHLNNEKKMRFCTHFLPPVGISLISSHVL